MGKQTAVCCHVRHHKQQQHGAGIPATQPICMPWMSMRFVMVVGHAQEGHTLQLSIHCGMLLDVPAGRCKPQRAGP